VVVRSGEAADDGSAARRYDLHAEQPRVCIVFNALEYAGPEPLEQARRCGAEIFRTRLVSREPGTLDDDYAMTGAREPKRRSRSCRPRSDDDNIPIPP
jgi:hypothetical protein